MATVCFLQIELTSSLCKKQEKPGYEVPLAFSHSFSLFLGTKIRSMGDLAVHLTSRAGGPVRGEPLPPPIGSIFRG